MIVRKRRDPGHILLGDNHELCQGPGQMFTEETVSRAERMVPSFTVPARVAGDPRIDHHAIARAHRRYVIAKRLDGPRAVSTENMRKLQR